MEDILDKLNKTVEQLDERQIPLTSLVSQPESSIQAIIPRDEMEEMVQRGEASTTIEAAGQLVEDSEFLRQLVGPRFVYFRVDNPYDEDNYIWQIYRTKKYRGDGHGNT